MRITLKTTGAVLLTEELRAFAEEKVEKLGKLLDPEDSTILAEVELESVANARTGGAFRAEINLSFAGGFIRAESSRETMHAAIDAVVAEAKREVRHARTRHRDLVRRGATKVKDFFRRFRS